MTVISATVLAAAGSAADAASSVYRGSYHPSGSINFQVVHRKGGRTVTQLVFSQFPLKECDHGANTETSSLSYAVDLKGSSFHTVGIIGRRHHPKSELILRGDLAVHGKASGTMRVFGSAVPVEDTTHGARDNCDSGVVHWTAKRQRSH